MDPQILGPLATLVGFLFFLIAGFLLRPKRPSTFMGMRVEYRDNIPPGEIWIINPKYIQSPAVMTSAIEGILRNVR